MLKRKAPPPIKVLLQMIQIDVKMVQRMQVQRPITMPVLRPVIQRTVPPKSNMRSKIQSSTYNSSGNRLFKVDLKRPVCVQLCKCYLTLDQSNNSHLCETFTYRRTNRSQLMSIYKVFEFYLKRFKKKIKK